MTIKRKLFFYDLRAIPNSKDYYFLQVDLEKPKAGKAMSLNKTENEIREFYARLGYSDGKIDTLLCAARKRQKT
jgi:hypothetical protein